MNIPKPYIIAASLTLLMTAQFFISKQNDLNSYLKTQLAEELPSDTEPTLKYYFKKISTKVESLLPQKKLTELSNKKMNYFADYLESYLLRSLTTGADDRKVLVSLGAQDPLNFTKAMQTILTQLPPDQVEVRESILGLSIDVIADSKNLREEAPELNSKVMAEANSMALFELSIPELVASDLAKGLSNENAEDLIHEGFFVEKNGHLYRSTLSSKIMALKLVTQDSDSPRRAQILKNIEQRSGTIDSHSLETIKMAAMR